MKITMLGHKRFPSREDGIEVVVTELATRMVKLGHTVVCLNRHGHHVDTHLKFTSALAPLEKSLLQRWS